MFSISDTAPAPRPRPRPAPGTRHSTDRLEVLSLLADSLLPDTIRLEHLLDRLEQHRGAGAQR